MQIQLRGRRERNKLIVSMAIPTAHPKEVLTMEMPDNGDWRADMECYDKVLAAYEERWSKTIPTESTKEET